MFKFVPALRVFQHAGGRLHKVFLPFPFSKYGFIVVHMPLFALYALSTHMAMQSTMNSLRSPHRRLPFICAGTLYICLPIPYQQACLYCIPLLQSQQWYVFASLHKYTSERASANNLAETNSQQAKFISHASRIELIAYPTKVRP